MNIYLNNHDIVHANSSFLKSSGKITAFYFTFPFTLPHFYVRTVFPTKFLLPNCRPLPHICILDLLSGMSFTLIIPILST